MLPTAALVLAMVSGAVAQCSTSTETVLAVATTLSDFSLFRASMDQIYSTVEDAFTGATVYVWTTLDDSPDAGTFTAYGVYDANALISAGYSITTEMAEVTVCETPAEETGALPPSPTGADCSPHGDHWHCDEVEETGAASAGATPTEAGTCEPHGDHWHCPPGVPEPTAPPAASATGDDHDHDDEAPASTCEPHGDHWHCPSGVAEPTAPPAASATGDDHDHDHDDEAPASTCEPHGDHWHYPSGVAEPTAPPAMTTSSPSTLTTSEVPAASTSLAEFTGAANRDGVAAHVLGFGVVAGLIRAFALWV